MALEIGSVAVVVPDYDEAISYYTSVLGFDLSEDTDLGGGKRWVLVRPPGGGGTCLLLARAVTFDQESRIGDQTGGEFSCFCIQMIFGVIPARESCRPAIVFA